MAGNVEDLKGKMLRQLLKNLNDSGLSCSYEVTHGWTPEGSAGRDLDLFVTRTARKQVAEITERFFKQNGWMYHIRISPWAEFVVVYKEIDKVLVTLEIDTYTEQGWMNVCLTMDRAPLNSYLVDGIPFAIWNAFSKRIFLPFLTGDLERKYARQDKLKECVVYPHEYDVVQKHLESVFGITPTRRLLSHIQNHDWCWLKENRRKYGLALMFGHAVRHPFASLGFLLQRAKNKKWLRDEAEAIQDVYCLGKDGIQAERFAEALVLFLSNRSIFSPVQRKVVETSSDIASYKSAGSVVGLTVFHGKKSSVNSGFRRGIFVDIDAESIESAIRKITHEYFMCWGASHAGGVS